MNRSTRPLTSAQARKKRPIRATQPSPQPMPTQTHSTFVTTDRREPPMASLRVVPVSTRGSSALWRVDLEIGGAAFVPRTEPRAERRVVTATLRRRARGRAEPLPFRPAWASQTFTPIRGPLVPRHRVLHRGRELEPLFVFPPDRRFVYFDQSYPWRCVGRIVVPGAIGSGVLIGPRHVLTARNKTVATATGRHGERIAL